MRDEHRLGAGKHQAVSAVNAVSYLLFEIGVDKIHYTNTVATSHIDFALNTILCPQNTMMN